MGVNNSLLKSIQTIVNKEVESASFDKTRQAQIITNNNDGTYTIRLDGVLYNNVLAYPYTDVLSVGDVVKVCIPSNQTSHMYIKSSQGDKAYVKKSGDIMTGNLNILRATGETKFQATRTDTGNSIWMGVGGGGTNKGLYDVNKDRWLFYTDDSATYIYDGSSGTNRQLDIQTANTTNTWVLVMNGDKIQHRVIPANLVTGVKGNAESSYRTGNVNLTSANIGALALSGGTLTGNLTIKKDSPNQIIQKSTTIDITKADNNLEADVFDLMYLQRQDKNGVRVGDIYNRTEGTGHGARSCMVIRATNKKSDGTVVDNTLEIRAHKDGTRSYGVSDTTAFKTAIGLGNVNNTADANKTVAKANKLAAGTTVKTFTYTGTTTWKRLGTYTFEPGFYCFDAEWSYAAPTGIALSGSSQTSHTEITLVEVTTPGRLYGYYFTGVRGTLNVWVKCASTNSNNNRLFIYKIISY